MKKTLNFFAVCLFLFVVAQPVMAKKPVNPPGNPPPPSTKIWGAYTGNNDQTMAAFETYVGKSMAINAMFWGWDSPFPTTSTGSQGKTLLLFWDPWVGFDQINNGSRDAYIAQFARGAKAYGYPVILAPFSEFNLNETPWGNGIGTNTPQSFIAAWRRVRSIFTANAATNVKFGLAYNNVSIPATPFASFYPGNEYVDYVGIDGFNFGGQTFAQVFNNARAEAQAFGKPIWLMSTGSVAPQSQFILDMGASGLPWVWFNQSPFKIDSNSLPAFKSII